MDVRSILDVPVVYSLWQAPFVRQKVAPFLEHNNPAEMGRVLEIGCGPGTNAPMFRQADYVGIDLNPAYVESARRRYGRTFICGDASKFELPAGEPFDVVFINSLLHHLDDEAVSATMDRASQALRPGGKIHILDLLLPEEKSLARYLAQADRGGFARALAAWEDLLTARFEAEIMNPFSVRALGTACWKMFYFRGNRRD